MKKLLLPLVFILGLALGAMLDRWQILGAEASSISEAQVATTQNTAKSGRQDISEEAMASLYRRIDELEAALAIYRDTEQQDHQMMLEKKEKHIVMRLLDYTALFELSAEQAWLIGEWEWEIHQIWLESMRTGNMANLPKIEERVMPILSPGQQEIYQAHLEEKARNIAELSAQARLSNYPVTLNLTEEQKNGLYQKLFYLIHEETRNQFSDRRKELELEGVYIPQNISLILAAEGVLDPEQLELLREISRKK